MRLRPFKEKARPVTDMSAAAAGLSPFSTVPFDRLTAEWQLMNGILARTIEDGNETCEAAARRCLATLEDALLARGEC